MKKIINIFVLLFIGFSVSSCLKQKAQDLSFEDIIKNEGLIVDVREKEEIDEGMVSGASWFPLSKIKENPEEEIAKLMQIAEGKKVYFYCKSGKRASEYMKYFENKNIEAINLGGYDQLFAKGFPVKMKSN